MIVFMYIIKNIKYKSIKYIKYWIYKIQSLQTNTKYELWNLYIIQSTNSSFWFVSYEIIKHGFSGGDNNSYNKLRKTICSGAVNICL